MNHNKKYRKRDKSISEFVIILIGALLILSIAFYMAKERSLIPYDETIIRY